MRRINVQSAIIKSAGYDRDAKILELEFRDTGEIWRYYSFPPMAYKKFINSPSPGDFFNTRVRNKYHEEQVTG